MLRRSSVSMSRYEDAEMSWADASWSVPVPGVWECEAMGGLTHSMDSFTLAFGLQHKFSFDKLVVGCQGVTQVQSQ